MYEVQVAGPICHLAVPSFTVHVHVRCRRPTSHIRIGGQLTGTATDSSGLWLRLFTCSTPALFLILGLAWGGSLQSWGKPGRPNPTRSVYLPDLPIYNYLQIAMNGLLDDKAGIRPRGKGRSRNRRVDHITSIRKICTTLAAERVPT